MGGEAALAVAVERDELVAAPECDRPAACYRSVLLAYASAADDIALEHAIVLATAHRASLTVVAPVPRLSYLAALADADLEQLKRELLDHADATVRRAEARVPGDVSLVLRCVPRERERAVALELERGTYDLLILGHGGRDPGALWGRMGTRLMRDALRHGVATLAVPTSRRRRPRSTRTWLR